MLERNRMTRLEFAIMLKEESFEFFGLYQMDNVNWWVCLADSCIDCEYAYECGKLFDGKLPKLIGNELEEFLNLYPELRVIL